MEEDGVRVRFQADSPSRELEFVVRMIPRRRQQDRWERVYERIIETRGGSEIKIRRVGKSLESTFNLDQNKVKQSVRPVAEGLLLIVTYSAPASTFARHTKDFKYVKSHLKLKKVQLPEKRFPRRRRNRQGGDFSTRFR